MKILLINDNPVVNKLVTLSAQKTSDELEVVDNLDAIAYSNYDLVVIDDTLYSDDLLVELNEKIKYTKSLYVCSRDAEAVETFTEVLKKPFLPTDLVELFATIGQDVLTVDLDSEDEIDSFEDISLDGVEDFDDILELDDLESDSDDLDLEDLSENILDNEEAQKVKNLLEETEDEVELTLEEMAGENTLDADVFSLDEFEDDDSSSDFELDSLDSLDIEDETLEDEEVSLDELSLEDETLEDEEVALDEFSLEDEPLEDEEVSLDELSLEDEALEDEEVALDELSLEDETLEDEELDIEAQIESAVTSLSEEELESEMDEELLLDIVTSDIDSLDALTSRDLKIAFGEEVDENSSQMIEENEDEVIESATIEEDSEKVDGVEALKNLLSALNDKNVAASMKGMKISINITLGDA